VCGCVNIFFHRCAWSVVARAHKTHNIGTMVGQCCIDHTTLRQWWDNVVLICVFCGDLDQKITSIQRSSHLCQISKA